MLDTTARDMTHLSETRLESACSPVRSGSTSSSTLFRISCLLADHQILQLENDEDHFSIRLNAS